MMSETLNTINAINTLGTFTGNISGNWTNQSNAFTGNIHGNWTYIDELYSLPTFKQCITNIINNKYEIITLPEHFDLYYLAPKNVLENYEEYEYLTKYISDYKCKYVIEPNIPLEFGLTEEYTLYYDSRNLLSNKQFQCEHIKFITKTQIKLVFINERFCHEIEKLYKFLNNNGIDGYIYQEDMWVNYYKICLINPFNIIDISSHELLQHDFLNEIKHYPSRKDKEILDKFCKVI